MTIPLPAISVPPDSIPLDTLPTGICAVVQQVEASDNDMRRLMTLGICVGRRLEMTQRGNPMILRVLGTRLGVSQRLAARVFVRPCNHLGCSA